MDCPVQGTDPERGFLLFFGLAGFLSFLAFAQALFMTRLASLGRAAPGFALGQLVRTGLHGAVVLFRAGVGGLWS